MIKINGENVNADGKTVEEYIKETGFDKSRLAVEKNGHIVPRAKYSDEVLCEGDVLEIVSFVGGG